MPMKIIDNFTGRLTRDNIGDMNSGMAKYPTTFGNDPFTNISNLTWLEQPIQIDHAASVITDCITAARPRLESGITYVYAIGHTGRLYKIQVNQPSGYNPNLDTPLLLTTLTQNGGSGNPINFRYGASIQFYGATEKIFVGGDAGVTKVNFDGTAETYLGTPTVVNCPRPSVNFLGVLYFGNGNNLIAVDSTETIITNTKLTPALDQGMQVRDLDISVDGNYVHIVASKIAAPDMTVGTQDTSSLSSSDSAVYFWNGIDQGVTSKTSFNSYLINANTSFGSNTYTTGYDFGGAAIYTSGQKIVTLQNATAPTPNAVFSSGNMLGIANAEITNGFLTGAVLMYGQYDFEKPKGLYRFLRQSAEGAQTDILNIPYCSTVSNLFYGSSYSGYTNNQVGSAKIYFSTVESNATTTKYKFYKFITFPTGTGDALNGVYETQNSTSFHLFRSVVSKKFKPTLIRLYAEPMTTNVQFRVDIIGSDGNPMSGGSKTVTIGSGDWVNGQDSIWYTPQTEPTYSMGIRITNLGIVNWTLVKMEVEYEDFGV